MRSKNKEPSLKRQEVKNQLETMLTEFPNFSIRKSSSSIKVSATMFYTILHHDTFNPV